MKKLSIVAILVIAIVSLVGCSTQAIPHQATASLGANYVEEETLAEEQVEDTTQATSEQKQETQIRDTKDYEELKGVLKQMKVRIIGENEIEELGSFIKIDGVVYTNPEHNPDIDIKALGYKNLFIDDIPTFDTDTQKCQRYYYDDGELIHRGWKVVDLTEEELAELAKEKASMGE